MNEKQKIWLGEWILEDIKQEPARIYPLDTGRWREQKIEFRRKPLGKMPFWYRWQIHALARYIENNYLWLLEHSCEDTPMQWALWLGRMYFKPGQTQDFEEILDRQSDAYHFSLDYA